jgi:hypothetical protein
LLSTPPPRCFPHCGRSAPAPHRCERCALPMRPMYMTIWGRFRPHDRHPIGRFVANHPLTNISYHSGPARCNKKSHALNCQHREPSPCVFPRVNENAFLL